MVVIPMASFPRGNLQQTWINFLALVFWKYASYYKYTIIVHYDTIATTKWLNLEKEFENSLDVQEKHHYLTALSKGQHKS